MASTAMMPHGRATLKRLTDARGAIDAFAVPESAWVHCPWEPRALIEEGLRQWLRCASLAMFDGQIIGMPSKAVDELWHGLITDTETYAKLCVAAFGRMLHHQPEGDAEAPDPLLKVTPKIEAQTVHGQLGRTVVAWELVADPGEACVLWDLDERVGVDHPWGVSPAFVAQVLAALRGESDADRGRSVGLPTG